MIKKKREDLYDKTNKTLMKRAKQDLSKEIYHIHGLEDNIVKCHFPQNCFVHLDKLIPNV